MPGSTEATFHGLGSAQYSQTCDTLVPLGAESAVALCGRGNALGNASNR